MGCYIVSKCRSSGLVIKTSNQRGIGDLSNVHSGGGGEVAEVPGWLSEAHCTPHPHLTTSGLNTYVGG